MLITKLSCIGTRFDYGIVKNSFRHADNIMLHVTSHRPDGRA